jgi:nitrite reductase/ring-hydroxylating ferredoxin subunit
MRPDRLRVPNVGSLVIGEAVCFEFRRNGAPERAFVLRHPAGFSAFVNCCPHWYVDLDLGDGRFFDERTERIYCKNHGALFHPETGLCEHGPCRGEFLESLTLVLDGDDALVELPGPLRIV